EIGDERRGSKGPPVAHDVQRGGGRDLLPLHVEAAGPPHPGEHLAHPAPYRVLSRPGIDTGRRASDGGEQRGLPHRERRGRTAEVRLHAASTPTRSCPSATRSR